MLLVQKDSMLRNLVFKLNNLTSPICGFAHPFHLKIEASHSPSTLPSILVLPVLEEVFGTSISVSIPGMFVVHGKIT